MNPTFIASFEQVVGAEHVVQDSTEMAVYESDGLAKLRSTPGLVVLPGTAAEVQQVVRLCHDAGVPFVARGQGTGLSGGPCLTPTASSS